MRLFALLVLGALSLCAEVSVSVHKFPSRWLSQTLKWPTQSDSVQIWVKTDDAKTEAFKLTLRYLGASGITTLHAVVQRLANSPTSGHSFNVPSLDIRIISVSVEELHPVSSSEFTAVE